MIPPISSGLPLLHLSGLRLRDRIEPEPLEPPPQLRPDEVAKLVGRLRDLETVLERVEVTAAKSSGGGSSPKAASAQSASIGLAFENSFTTLRSTEEINATPTSFAPRGPSFSGPWSTTLPTIDGTYYGAVDDTLTFTAKDDGIIGLNTNLKVEVRDGQGTKIDEVNFKGLAAGTPLTLSNGLTLSLSAGFLKKNETFQVDVFGTVGSVVDPNKAFNGTRNNDPSFEYGLDVTAGSFQVNGVTIDVLGTDTINTVLAKITASAANVTASFDAATESVVLTQKTAGQEFNIVLSNDTSGFLAATKLANAVAVLPEFSELNSSEEVNMTPTSFTPRGPSFSGPGSTTLSTVGGVYSGAQGNDTLIFKAKNNGTIGTDTDLKIEVRDGQDAVIDEVNFRGLAPGTALTLANGLTLSLSAGFLKKDETFEVDVFATIGSAVDPDKPFNGTRNDDPSFEDGLDVTAGSFQVNGVTIDVLGTDTINTVLAKITASDAGVSATFNTQTERVGLSRTTAGSFLDIVLSNDTSGFLAATKLDDPLILQGGQGYDADRIIADVPALSGISTGYFEINGVQVTVDVDADSLNDVIARINASAAEVTASLNPSTGRLKVTAHSQDVELVLDDGTSGFFSALEIDPGTYEATLAKRQGSLAEPRPLREKLRDAGRLLDEIFRFTGMDQAVPDAVQAQLRGVIRDAFTASLGAGDRSILRSGMGIDFDFRDLSRGVFRLDVSRFDRSAREDFGTLADLFFRKGNGSSSKGLIPTLLDTVRNVRGALLEALQARNRSGLLVDLSA